MVCGSVWHCPVCAAKIAERRREELAAAFASCRVLGGRVVMATFTISHGRRDTLNGLLGRFLAAYRSMTSTRAYKSLVARYGLVGTVKGLETTVGGNGWHPHAHTAMFLPVEVDPARLADDLYPVWAAAAARNGLTMTRSRGLDVSASEEKLAQYVAKWGHQPTRRLWDVEDELTRAHSKRGRTGEGELKGLRRLICCVGWLIPASRCRWRSSASMRRSSRAVASSFGRLGCGRSWASMRRRATKRSPARSARMPCFWRCFRRRNGKRFGTPIGAASSWKWHAPAIC